MTDMQATIKQTEFFTTAELAEKLKMNVQVITRKVQAGEIMAYKIGKDWRIPEQSVATWLEQNSNRQRKNGAGAARAESTAETAPVRTKRKYLLEYILAQFEPNRLYSEDEVNRLIMRHHDDSVSVRKEFLAERMMDLIDGKYRRRTDYKLAG